jgi:hypothetical protein
MLLTIILSSSLTPVQELDIGDEVRFTIKKNINKLSAENVTKLASGTISTHVRFSPFFLPFKKLDLTSFFSLNLKESCTIFIQRTYTTSIT